MVTVHCIRDKNSGYDLIATSADGDADHRPYVPVTLRRLLGADKEYNQAHNAQNKSDVTEPQAVFGFRLAVDFLCTQIHPAIRQDTTKLLTQKRSDDRTQELKSELLGIQIEFCLQQTGDFHSGHYVAQTEHHGVCGSGDGNTRMRDHAQGSEELLERQGSRVNTSELGILPYPSGLFGVMVASNIPGLRTQKEIQDELHTVDLNIGDWSAIISSLHQ